MFLINTLQNWFGRTRNPDQSRNVHCTAAAQSQIRTAKAKRLSPLWPLVETACEEQGLVKAEAATWIAAVIELGIIDSLNTEVILEKICTSGRALTENEKRSHGIFGPDTYGAQYVSALTEEGLRVPEQAASYLVHEVLDQRLSVWRQQRRSEAKVA